MPEKYKPAILNFNSLPIDLRHSRMPPCRSWTRRCTCRPSPRTWKGSDGAIQGGVAQEVMLCAPRLNRRADAWEPNVIRVLHTGPASHKGARGVSEPSAVSAPSAGKRQEGGNGSFLGEKSADWEDWHGGRAGKKPGQIIECVVSRDGQGYVLSLAPLNRDGR